jgi:hypothetical protein
MTYQEILGTVRNVLLALGGTATVADLHAALLVRGFTRFSRDGLRIWIANSERYGDFAITDDMVN